MRQFYIQNEYGQKIELQGGSIFMSDPSGFGFADDVQYMESDGFFVETFREEQQLEKTGTLIFKPNEAYANYFSFANWVFAAQSLILAYNPDGNWFYINIDINEMSKSELTTAGLLEIPIVYTPVSPWYSPYSLNLTIDGVNTDNAKLYTYIYPYTYTTSAQAGVLNFTAQAQVPCDFEINIPGPVENPVITVTRLDTNTVIGEIDLSTVSADEGETIRFSNVPTSAGATLLTSSGIQDLTSQLGISTDLPTFFRLPANIPVEFTLTATSLLGVTASLKIYRYYRTV